MLCSRKYRRSAKKVVKSKFARKRLQKSTKRDDIWYPIIVFHCLINVWYLCNDHDLTLIRSRSYLVSAYNITELCTLIQIIIN